VSEPAEREVKETSVTWRDCCVQMCLPAASSNAAVGPEQTVRGASCLVNQRQFVPEDKCRDMVAYLRVGEYVYPTRACTAR
jgi:hypothetical protein